MSGGSYDYLYFKLSELADSIEADFVNDGKYMGDDWSKPSIHVGGMERHQIEYDRIGDATEEERPIILTEIKSLIVDLKKCSARAKELEWYMSRDTGATSYLERLREADLIK